MTPVFPLCVVGGSSCSVELAEGVRSELGRVALALGFSGGCGVSHDEYLRVGEKRRSVDWLVGKEARSEERRVGKECRN